VAGVIHDDYLVRGTRGEAVVCGASLAGLLAARVLSEFYESVTIVERDGLPAGAAQRRGVAQGRHLHMLLTRGLMHLVELFPGLVDDLADDGALALDGTDLSGFYIRVGHSEMTFSGAFTRPKDLFLVLASRPLLEYAIRQRVRAIGNVTFLDGHDVVEPCIESGRVAGCRVVHRESGQERRLDCRLYVDAAGRAARTPALLQSHGYPQPPEKTYPVHLNYASQVFRIPPGALDQRVAMVSEPLARAAGAGFVAYENDTAMLTLIGLGGYRPATDVSGFLDAATQVLPAEISSVLRASEAVGAVCTQHYPVSTWRRYDKLRRLPEGLLVLGDAMCSLNPVWGQGMTSAALQAAVLRRCLASGVDDLQRAYFSGVAKKLAPIWRSNRMLDFSVAPADDLRRIPKRLLNRITEKVWVSAETDTVMTETFVRTIELLDPITVWLQPATLKRIVGGRR
jgi:2-polyprenyl-6-methoxyphenol hydroxylase-like FAD-dependent oxidoreductase